MGSDGALGVFLGTVIAFASVGGCGGSGNDAPTDAGGHDAFETLCPVPEGRSYICTQWRLQREPAGYDLDADEVIDNELGKLPQSVLDSVHVGLDESLQVGETLQLLHITDWSEPPTPNDEDIGLHIFIGRDADTPSDPSNNYNGDGEFFIRRNEFDVACNSTTQAEEAALVDRVLTATNEQWAFAISEGTGTMRFTNVILTVTFDADFETAIAECGAMLTLCSLSQVPFPGETPGTVLDAFANDPTIRESISVDMDRDGDGLEEVVGDGVSILECIDGDGTVIPGRDCPCHPDIADAYSLFLRFPLARAAILGVL